MQNESDVFSGRGVRSSRTKERCRVSQLVHLVLKHIGKNYDDALEPGMSEGRGGATNSRAFTSGCCGSGLDRAGVAPCFRPRRRHSRGQLDFQY